MHHAHGCGVIAQGFGSVRCGVQQQVFRGAHRHQMAAAFATFRPQVNQPVRGAHHVQVVLNDQQRMPGIQQLAQGTHQLGDVIKVQASGWLIQHEQRPAPGCGLAAAGAAGAAGAAAFGGFGQKPGQLEPLRLAAGECWHRLAQLDVLQAHIHDGLQHANHIALGAEPVGGLADGQVQHIGHIQRAALALQRDFQNFRAVALAVAVRAAQIDITEELHLHMLKAGTAAGGAAAIATVEAELGAGIAPFARQGGVGKQLPNGIPGTDIAHRVGACRLANRGLVNKHHFAELLRPQQTGVCAWRIGGLAEVAQQRRGQHVLHQRGFAGTADAGDAHQPLQGNFHVDVLEVVLRHALQNQARGIGCHHALEAHADLLAAAQIGTRQGVGSAQCLGAAVKHNLPAFFARPRPHVDDAVSSQHHRRVVLHHHQGVAGIAQTLHGHGDAVHVTRVQPDAGFVQHKQGVHQRSAQRRGEVDALHFATAEGAALAVQREVANANLAEVLEAGADFFKQQLEGFGFGFGGWGGGGGSCRGGGGGGGGCGGGGCGGAAGFVGPMRRGGQCQIALQAIKKPPQTLQRQQHQIVQTQARQRLQLRPAPAHALWQKALRGWQHGIGLRLAANAPEQAFGLEPGTRTSATRRVAAVLGQQHADVHLVGLGFQVFKKPVHAKPMLVPFAVPVR